MNSQLVAMRMKWESLGITPHFPKVHHFSSIKFKSKPSGLEGFINWCNKREIKQENFQTIQRALMTASLFEKSHDIDKAIAEA